MPQSYTGIHICGNDLLTYENVDVHIVTLFGTRKKTSNFCEIVCSVNSRHNDMEVHIFRN